MNILSANWANPDKTVVCIYTDTAGAVLVSLNEPQTSGEWHAIGVKWLKTNSPQESRTDPSEDRRSRIESARKDLRVIFSTMPATARASFYSLNSALKSAFDAGDVEAALIIISAVTPPIGLESVKTQAVSVIQQITS